MRKTHNGVLLAVRKHKRFTDPAGFLSRFFFIGILTVLVWVLVFWLFRSHDIALPLPDDCNETASFRQMALTDDILKNWNQLQTEMDDDCYQILAVLMAATDFQTDTKEKTPDLPVSLEEYDVLADFYEEEYSDELALLSSSYETLLKDLVYFPVMKSSRQDSFGISYADGWLSDRAYQNTTHLHEGTDIMALNNERGYYPIVSMTDGIIENIGWLEKGGYRVGIRSPHGAYLYYAHLYRYAEGLEEGSTVKAGQLLGFMGDSGYSKVEGTVGNFDVHLHLGIYLQTEHYEELSVNPYRILKLLEENVVLGDY